VLFFFFFFFFFFGWRLNKTKPRNLAWPAFAEGACLVCKFLKATVTIIKTQTRTRRRGDDDDNDDTKNNIVVVHVVATLWCERSGVRMPSAASDFK